MGKHNEFGKLGEEKAAAFLQNQGYTVQYRNYRYLKGEIDIIAQKEKTLAIVEVKSRSSDYIEPVAETVNQKKINLLVATADHFVQHNDLDVEVRFDIITVLKKGSGYEIEHLEGAFHHF
ncbi:YraN family protein [uncultured Croceitalea sp.]|uniref:YraN family protein n=1 Tax=uncultured Croceitalea sp. TaxID=1798908 RepID=UPI0033057164